MRSAEELCTALTAPDLATLLSALRAIVARPQWALALGACRGRDVIDVLLRLADAARGRSDGRLYVATLSEFEDPRVLAFFKHVFAAAADAETTFLAARGLARQRRESLRAFLGPYLLGNDAARARAAADLLAGCPSLSMPERVRVAMLGETRQEAPALDAETLPLWLAELDGPFAPDARTRLERQGAPAFACLAGLWDRLPLEARVWLLRWGVEQWPSRMHALLVNALESESDDVVLAALRLIAELEDTAPCARAVSRFAEHPDVAFRLAAVRAGATGFDWREVFTREPDPAVRLACIARLGAEEGSAAIPDLVVWLQSEDWPTRAAARDALVRLGAAVTEEVEPLTRSVDEGVRAVAVRILSAVVIAPGRDENTR